MENILNKIQKELKAPKTQKNTFGNYNYRSCEDILEAVKPLLGEATLVLNDEIVMIGDRFYVKATATISWEGGYVSSSAYARESVDKKGMDVAQITGAASSYARKYALNGLFCIDDTKDADTVENKSDKITASQAQQLHDRIVWLEASEPSFLKYLGIEKLEDMLVTDLPKAEAALKAKENEKKAKA